MSPRRSTRHRFKGKPQSRAVWMKGPHDGPEDTDASKARCTCWHCCEEIIAVISRQWEQPAGRRQIFHRDETGKIIKITFEPVTFTRGAANRDFTEQVKRKQAKLMRHLEKFEKSGRARPDSGVSLERYH